MSNNCIPKCMLVCKPEGGKGVSGGQRRRWVDVVMTNQLKTCECILEWCQLPQNWAQWRELVSEAAENWNEQLEAAEKTHDDERKQRREQVVDASVDHNKWACSEPGCGFLAQSKAGLVNHTRQIQYSAAWCQLRCPHCRQCFKDRV